MPTAFVVVVAVGRVSHDINPRLAKLAEQSMNWLIIRRPRHQVDLADAVARVAEGVAVENVQRALANVLGIVFAQNATSHDEARENATKFVDGLLTLAVDFNWLLLKDEQRPLFRIGQPNPPGMEIAGEEDN